MTNTEYQKYKAAFYKKYLKTILAIREVYQKIGNIYYWGKFEDNPVRLDRFSDPPMLFAWELGAAIYTELGSVDVTNFYICLENWHLVKSVLIEKFNLEPTQSGYLEVVNTEIGIPNYWKTENRYFINKII
jgi:hypothetical protein